MIHYLATEGVVHLDVKPDNIVMGIPPRLIDLSLARTVKRARRLDHWIGTNAYMLPEQCAPGAAGEIGPATDVWGLGATIPHAVAGEVPFSRPRSIADSDPLEARFPQLVEEPRRLPDGVTAELRAAMAATLPKDPAARPTAAELDPIAAAPGRRAPPQAPARPQGRDTRLA